MVQEMRHHIYRCFVVLAPQVPWYRRKRRWLEWRCAIVVVATEDCEENAAWIMDMGVGVRALTNARPV